MTAQQWRIRVYGVARKEVNTDLLMAAIVALVQHLNAQARERPQQEGPGTLTASADGSADGGEAGSR